MGKELNVLNGHTECVNSILFSTDGTCIVSGSSDKSVRVWDALVGKKLNALNSHTEGINSVTFLTDGIFVSGSPDKSVQVWNMQPSYIQEQTKCPLDSPTYTGWLLSADRQAQDKPTSCMCHLMLCYLTLSTFLPYPTRLLPMLILPMPPLALSGVIVMLHSSVLHKFYLHVL